MCIEIYPKTEPADLQADYWGLWYLHDAFVIQESPASGTTYGCLGTKSKSGDVRTHARSIHTILIEKSLQLTQFYAAGWEFRLLRTICRQLSNLQPINA